MQAIWLGTLFGSIVDSSRWHLVTITGRISMRACTQQWSEGYLLLRQTIGNVKTSRRKPTSNLLVPVPPLARNNAPSPTTLICETARLDALVAAKERVPRAVGREAPGAHHPRRHPWSQPPRSRSSTPASPGSARFRRHWQINRRSNTSGSVPRASANVVSRTFKLRWKFRSTELPFLVRAVTSPSKASNPRTRRAGYSLT